MSKQRKIGEVAPGRIPVLDRAGNDRGNVGPKATAATTARFLGHHGAKLKTKNGRKVWQSPNAKFNADTAERNKAGAKATAGQLVAAGALKP
jgi:hypothetical protein